MALTGFVSSSRENLASRTYAQLREALMAGRFWPGQRLRIRELSAAMGVSDTPVREAIMQLVREGGLEMRSGQSITVTRLSLTRYRELREMRLFLEGLATEKAVSLLTGADLKQLKKLHDALVRAEKDGDSEVATLTNFNFHFLIYRASQAEDLVSILETIWLRNGPLLKFLYPHARPTYPGRHQHLILMQALQERDAVAARQAIQDDILEGGALLVKLLSKIESGQAVVKEDAEGNMHLEFLTPAMR